MKTLTAFYDLAFGPVSYDVIPFLIQARMAMEDQKCKALHVVIVPDANGVDGMFRDKTKLYDAAEMHWRLWNIVIPACRLMGASVTLATDWLQAERLDTGPVWPEDWRHQSVHNRHHLARPLFDAIKAGRAIPRLRASEHARKAVRAMAAKDGRPLITITQRNTYEPGRNSDPGLWDSVWAWLSDRYNVARLYDTQDALVRGVGYGELNLDLRMAMYQEAVQNLHVHGGPMVLCWHSTAPFLIFDAARPRKDWLKNWETNVGLKDGEQVPDATPDRQLIYDETSYEGVQSAFRAWEASRG